MSRNILIVLQDYSIFLTYEQKCEQCWRAKDKTLDPPSFMVIVNDFFKQWKWKPKTYIHCLHYKSFASFTALISIKSNRGSFKLLNRQIYVNRLILLYYLFILLHNLITHGFSKRKINFATHNRSYRLQPHEHYMSNKAVDTCLSAVLSIHQEQSPKVYIKVGKWAPSNRYHN